MAETWLERVKVERQEVCLRLERLARFKLTDDFRALPNEERKLLIDQHRHMKAYADALYDRITLAHKRANEKPLS